MAKHSVILSDYKAKKADEGAIEIVGDNGEVFTVPPAALWPDEIADLRDNDYVAVAKLILGDEQFAAFVAAGGSAVLLQSIVQDELGGTAGE